MRIIYICMDRSIKVDIESDRRPDMARMYVRDERIAQRTHRLQLFSVTCQANKLSMPIGAKRQATVLSTDQTLRGLVGQIAGHLAHSRPQRALPLRQQSLRY